MDIFRLLSRGASLKGKHQQDLQIFRANDETEEETHVETDFFKGRERNSKRRLLEAAGDDNSNNNNNGTNDDEDDLDNIQVPPVITTTDQAELHRKKYHIRIYGDDAPLPIGSFTDLVSRFQLNKLLIRNLERMKFRDPTPIQSEAIPMLLHGRDLLGCAPTGSGKTLAFSLPVVWRSMNAKGSNLSTTGGPSNAPTSLIVSPTKELAKQIYNEIVQLSQGINEVKPILLTKSTAHKLSQGGTDMKFNFVVSTPLRLVEMARAGLVDLSHVKYLVFDEADKLFEGGFLEQIDEILSFCTNPKIQKALFSATIPSGVEELARSVMKDIGALRVVVGKREAASEDIEQKLVYTGNEYGKLVAIRQMVADDKSGFTPPVLIFVQSIERAKALFHEMLYDKVNVDVIHGERSQRQRDRVIERFKNGDIWVLICTDVLARGIDFRGVNLVINYDVPPTTQSYVHRVGRTGRAGRKGKAITFFTKEDGKLVKTVVNVMKQNGCDVGDWMNRLEKISLKEKKKLAHKPQRRDAISTVPKVVKQKRKERQEMIEGSKRRKLREDKKEEVEVPDKDDE